MNFGVGHFINLDFHLKSHPVTDVFIELQSRELQYYSMTLHITAHFSGLRYIMFHWPMLSAAIGECCILRLVCRYVWGKTFDHTLYRAELIWSNVSRKLVVCLSRSDTLIRSNFPQYLLQISSASQW